MRACPEPLRCVVRERDSRLPWQYLLASLEVFSYVSITDRGPTSMGYLASRALSCKQFFSRLWKSKRRGEGGGCCWTLTSGRHLDGDPRVSSALPRSLTFPPVVGRFSKQKYKMPSKIGIADQQQVIFFSSTTIQKKDSLFIWSKSCILSGRRS